MTDENLFQVIIDIIFFWPIILFPMLVIIGSILYASSKRFRKWTDDYDKWYKEWQEDYKKRERQRRYEKRLRRIEKEIEKTGTYTPSRSWKYYAQRNGFYPEDEKVD